MSMTRRSAHPRAASALQLAKQNLPTTRRAWIWAAFFFRNGNGHLKRGRGKATACGRDVALGGNTFLSSMPEIILKRVYGRRPRAMRPPSQRSTGAAHDDRDRSLLVPHSSQSTLCRGRRGNTSTIFIFTYEQRTTLNFIRPCTLPRGESDFSADAWGETPR